ncbi:hypothetical protein ACFQBQ_08715 [Granulicella cerasi]|uniref:Uncharacterized protein n=1 Tax=Granulicella cerasi TaxID=741063 RepID=A0ABW1Z8G6_9BACT|nr:hypothetical protein [Granulicella cerasi]
MADQNKNEQPAQSNSTASGSSNAPATSPEPQTAPNQINPSAPGETGTTTK